MPKATRLSLWPAGSPEASLSARPRLRLPRAPASLGQSAAWSALAGRIGPCFRRRHAGGAQPAQRQRAGRERGQRREG
eukprot:scaffold30844_cov37-Phaeocystis_antarctica.AAC.1